VHHAFVVKIIPRCNNCGLFFANAFTLENNSEMQQLRFILRKCFYSWK